MKIKIMNLVKESLPNFCSLWCACGDGKPGVAEWGNPIEDDNNRYMDNNACTCGVSKHHLHHNICGGLLQIG